jgi:hypothetical protein
VKDDTVVISERFCGIPGIALGGYACGLIAAQLSGGVEVTLRRPPPIARPLIRRRSSDKVFLLDGDAVIAQAVMAELDVGTPAPVGVHEAELAARRYAGFTRSPYPSCFCCGPERGLGDGLRIFPGPVDKGRVATAWSPHESLAGEDGRVAPEFLWAALDCPTYWGIDLAYAPLPALVTGRIHARIERPLRAGDPCVVVGWPISCEGRRFTGGAALFASSGELVALARAIWLARQSK